MRLKLKTLSPSPSLKNWSRVNPSSSAELSWHRKAQKEMNLSGKRVVSCAPPREAEVEKEKLWHCTSIAQLRQNTGVSALFKLQIQNIAQSGRKLTPLQWDTVRYVFLYLIFSRYETSPCGWIVQSAAELTSGKAYQSSFLLQDLGVSTAHKWYFLKQLFVSIALPFKNDFPPNSQIFWVFDNQNDSRYSFPHILLLQEMQPSHETWKSHMDNIFYFSFLKRERAQGIWNKQAKCC